MSLSTKEVVAEYFATGVEYGQEHNMKRSEFREVLEYLIRSDAPSIPCVVESVTDAWDVIVNDLDTYNIDTPSLRLDMETICNDPGPITTAVDWAEKDGVHICIKYTITPMSDGSQEVTSVSHRHGPSPSDMMRTEKK